MTSKQSIPDELPADPMSGDVVFWKGKGWYYTGIAEVEWVTANDDGTATDQYGNPFKSEDYFTITT